MPRGGKLGGTRDHKSLERLAGLCKFVRPTRKLSVRGCLYRLSAKPASQPWRTRQGIKVFNLFAGTDHNSYRQCKELIRTARVSCELDERLGFALDDCFEDNKRVLLAGETDGSINIADYMKPKDPRKYERNRWQDQPDRIQVWLEKDTLRGLVERVCWRKWDVSLLISMGTFGRTFLLRAAQRIDAAIKSGCRRIWIFFVGDFDPSGLAIEEWAREGNHERNNRKTEGLYELLQTKFNWTRNDFETRIKWRRIAVTEEDFLHNAALAPFKISIKEAGRDEETGKCKKGHDPRAEAYREKYGDLCLEAEALENLRDGEIASRLDVAIEAAIDKAAWERSERTQRREIAKWLREHRK